MHSWLIQSNLLCTFVRFSSRLRILVSLILILLVFVVTTVLVKVDVSACRMQFFGGTLASVALVSGASNIFSGSVFGISGHFPMRISQALISGIRYSICFHIMIFFTETLLINRRSFVGILNWTLLCWLSFYCNLEIIRIQDPLGSYENKKELILKCAT